MKKDQIQTKLPSKALLSPKYGWYLWMREDVYHKSTVRNVCMVMKKELQNYK
jgi:hypothetical protein